MTKNKKNQLWKLIKLLEVNHTFLVAALLKVDKKHDIKLTVSVISAICGACLKLEGNPDWVKFGSAYVIDQMLYDEVFTEQTQKEKEINSMRKKINLKN